MNLNGSNWIVGKLDVTKQLVESGANIEAKDKNEATPLHLSSENGN